MDLVEWHCRIAVEKRRAQDEMAREELRFATEWKAYETKLRKEVLKSKLPQEWIPQTDQVSGEEFFFNVKTTKVSKEHPNKLLFAQLIEKQRKRATEIFAEQIWRLEDYQQRLDAQLQDHTKSVLAALLSEWTSLN